MLVKQILVVSFILPVVVYYSFIAFRKITGNLHDINLRKSLTIVYCIISLAIISALVAFPVFAVTSWPSLFIKHGVSVLLALFIGQVALTVMMVAGDIFIMLRLLCEFLMHHFKKKRPDNEKDKQGITRSEFVSQIAVLLGSVFTMGLIYGMTNKYRYELRNVKIPVNDVQQGFRGLKIIQISDIHCGSLDNLSAVSDGFEVIMRQNPDLILFTGDLVNYRSGEVIPFMEIFKGISAPLGVYSILGNHDYGDYIKWPSDEAKQKDFNQLLAYQQNIGWQVIRNEHVVIQWNGKQFALIGTENWSIKERFPKYGDLDKAMAGAENTGVPLKILMSHDPTLWDSKVRPDYPEIFLTLSGHTHGMQLGIDNRYFKWSPGQYLYERWAGLYKEDKQFLYVNRGLGYIGYEGRLGIMPEVTLIELV